MRKGIQIRFQNIPKPAPLYVSECWTLRQKKKKNRINRTQMRLLRSLTGVSLRDRIRSKISGTASR